MIKYVAIAFAALALTGCAHEKKYNRVVDTATFNIEVVQTFPPHLQHVFANARALTECVHTKDETGKVVDIKDCTVYVLASTYPRCINHEIRHVLEGTWHPQRAHSSEDC